MYYNPSRTEARSWFRPKDCNGALEPQGLVAMKNIYEVLRNKELELARLRHEIEALRFVAPLLTTESAEAVPAPGLDTVWTPPLPRNKWPAKMDHPSPNYSDS